MSTTAITRWEWRWKGSRVKGEPRTGSSGSNRQTRFTIPRSLRRGALPLLVAFPLVARPAPAQQSGSMQSWSMPAEYREVQIRAQETQRGLLLAMADSMAEIHYRNRVTPEQRDFAQQIHHAANANLYIVSRYILGRDSLPFIQDTAATFNSRVGLKRFINASYDYSLDALRAQTADDRRTMTWYFGLRIPKWQIWDELNQHTLWTAGQIVANFRALGMAPPAFMYF